MGGMKEEGVCEEAQKRRQCLSPGGECREEEKALLVRRHRVATAEGFNPDGQRRHAGIRAFGLTSHVLTVPLWCRFSNVLTFVLPVFRCPHAPFVVPVFKRAPSFATSKASGRLGGKGEGRWE
eukprot:352206-Chlamydomonas_euryale.AAC.3